MQCRVVHDYTADANRCNTAARISYNSNEKEPKINYNTHLPNQPQHLLNAWKGAPQYARSSEPTPLPCFEDQ